MAEEQVESTECPYCKEEIRGDAVLCKHCGSRLRARAPEHGGVCPFCKEAIHPEATRCKHCRSNLEVRETSGCGCTPAGASRFGGAPRFSAAQAFSLQGGTIPDPECFHECFWSCIDRGGDPEFCWRACAWICPDVVVKR
jgi:uncharacterized CHY-type Zn-finger protein